MYLIFEEYTTEKCRERSLLGTDAVSTGARFQLPTGIGRVAGCSTWGTQV